jgi:hypothetical protein
MLNTPEGREVDYRRQGVSIPSNKLNAALLAAKTQRIAFRSHVPDVAELDIGSRRLITQQRIRNRRTLNETKKLSENVLRRDKVLIPTGP